MDIIEKDAPKIDAGTPLSKALSVMRDAGSPFIVVEKDGKYHGEITELLLERFSGDASIEKAGTIARKGTTLNAGSFTDEDAAALFLDESIEGVAVLDKNSKVAGVITARSLLPAVAGLPSLAGRRAGDYCRKVPALSEGDAASKANSVMLKAGVRELPVTDKRNHIIGRITAFGIATVLKPSLRMPARDRHPAGEKVKAEDAPVREIMESLDEAGIIGSGRSLAEAAAEMLKRGQDSLLVEDAGKPVGILTFNMLVSALEKPAFEKVQVFGLSPDEMMEKESVQAECAKFLEKIGSPANASLSLHVKDVHRGPHAREYSVRAKLSMDGTTLMSTPEELREHRENWDLHLAVKEALAEIRKQYEKTKPRKRRDAPKGSE